MVGPLVLGLETSPRSLATESPVRYRADVDGLRAVAVLAVVLFHAELGVDGGYIGVDVFFVISGYLITQLILKSGREFSLTEFWERRIRRIVPALTVMLATSLVAAWLFLFPGDLRRFGRSLVAQSLVASNFFFWRDSGYFDEGVRPLLHTWSLAVEEQFYLVFPLVFVVARKLSKARLMQLLGVLALASFAISVYGVYRRPLPAFYLLPPRAWELLVGALLAALPVGALRRTWVNEALSACGLLAILFASVTYSSDMRFPGPAALLPCLGAVAVIAGSSNGSTAVGRLLSWGPLVFIGKFSYSLYLWHWPVLTGAKYLFAPLTSLDVWGLVALSSVLGIGSWKLVEMPFRERRLLPGRSALFGTAAATTASFLLLGAWFAIGEGAPRPQPPQALRYLEGKSDRGFRVELGVDDMRAGKLIELGQGAPDAPIELVVWGDSHAMAVLHMVDILCRERGVRCVGATHSSTVPLLGIPGDGPYSLREDAQEYARLLLGFIATERVPKVLLAALWSGYDPTGELFQRALTETTRALSRTGAQPYVLLDVPYPDFDVPTALALSAARGQETCPLGVTRAAHEARNVGVKAVFEAQESAGLQRLDPLPAFLGERDRSLLERDGHALYFDHHHLSTHGSLLLRPVLAALFDPKPPASAHPSQPATSTL